MTRIHIIVCPSTNQRQVFLQGIVVCLLLETQLYNLVPYLESLLVYSSMRIVGVPQKNQGGELKINWQSTTKKPPVKCGS